MPTHSQAQRSLIFARRSKYKNKKNTPEKWKWIWDKDWENKGSLPKKIEKVDESKKRISTPPSPTFMIEDQIKKYLNGNTFFGVASFFLASSASGTEHYDENYSLKKKTITDFIKSQPYAVYVITKMDKDFYLGVTRTEHWWTGKDMKSILQDMSFSVALGMQGEPFKYIVYKDGKIDKQGIGMDFNAIKASSDNLSNESFRIVRESLNED